MAILVFASLGFAQLNVTNPFNCQNEYIVYNATSQLYTGVYDGCSGIPVIFVVNQSNVTVVNRTEIVVANYSINLTTFNCDESSLLQNFSNISNSFIGGIEERFNLTGLYSDCRYSRDTLQREVSECTNRVDNFTQNYISRVNAQVPVDSCNSNLNFTSVKLKDTESLLNYYALGGAVAASLLIWFFRLRGRDDNKDSIMPEQGDYDINTDVMEKRRKKVQSEADKEGSAKRRRR